MNKGIEILAIVVGGFLGVLLARIVIKLSLVYIQRLFGFIYRLFSRAIKSCIKKLNNRQS
jgi:hypothetical protein